MSDGRHDGEREGRDHTAAVAPGGPPPTDETTAAAGETPADDDWGDVQVGRWSRPRPGAADRAWEGDEGAWSGATPPERWRWGEGPGVERERPAAPRGRFAGVAPKGYRRSDARIHEDVCDRLTCDGEVDPSDVTVRVEHAEVTLEGAVDSAWTRRRIVACAETTVGVRRVHDRLHVASATGDDIDDSA